MTRTMDNRIRELRDARGLTQGQLADMVGVGWQTIQRLEQPGAKLSTQRIEQIAAALGVEPLEVLERRDFRLVAVRGVVQAGQWAESWALDDEDEPTIVPIPDEATYRGLRLYAAVTRGPSMNRVWREGTVVVFTDQVERGEQLVPGRRYIVERERADGLREATVKTLWIDDAGTP